ncbi:MAG: hypothetical protein LBV74_22710 [Tannerella sp.]|jgi:transcription antitermination factor NusG|nr:hypothetical protein [Tannerella sp.]
MGDFISSIVYIRGINEICNYVKSKLKRKDAVLSENEIERIHRLYEWLCEVAIEQGKIKAGDEEEVLAGHFKGPHGQVLDDSKRKRLRLAIVALGCVATVEVDGETVQKAI